MGTKRKSEIENDLRNDDQRYSFVSPSYVRSSVWKHYKVIKFLDIVQPFARCNHCAEILSYAPRSGTGSLLRHRCIRAKIISLPKDLPPVQNFVNLNHSTLPKKANDDLVKTQLEYILKDLRSPDSTEGNGFRKFAQALINIGAEYGKQNIDEILISSTNMINNLIPAEYFKMKNQLEYILSNNHIAFTTNMWIDEKSRRSFLTLTAHYINEDFILDSSLLGSREFTHNTEKTNDRIHFFVMDILNEFQIKDKLHQGVIVTENSPEFIETFRSYKRISCICHSLSLFMKEILENSNIKEVKELIKASKSLIRLDSDPNNPLTKPNETDTFNSVFNALSYVSAMYSEWEQALSERNEWQDVSAINFHLLESVLSFFGPFKDCFDVLGTQTIPAIAEYYMWFQKIRKCCLDNPKDSDVILELKAAARGKLDYILKPDILHYVAFFLNPQYKNMNIMSEEYLKMAQDAVKMLSEDLSRQQDTAHLMLSETMSNDTKPIVNKQKSPLFDLSEDVSGFSYLNEIDNELQKYLEINTEELNILDFWKTALELPLLRRICRQILNIPTSCMTCGRKMFTLGNILEDGRANISSDTIDQLLFLHINTGYRSQSIDHSMET